MGEGRKEREREREREIEQHLIHKLGNRRALKI